MVEIQVETLVEYANNAFRIMLATSPILVIAFVLMMAREDEDEEKLKLEKSKKRKCAKS